MNKICIKCHQEKELNEFFSCGKHYHSWCKLCKKEYDKEYRKLDKIKEYKKEYSKSEKYKEYRKRYNKSDQFKQSKKKYNQSMHGKIANKQSDEFRRSFRTLRQIERKFKEQI